MSVSPFFSYIQRTADKFDALSGLVISFHVAIIQQVYVCGCVERPTISVYQKRRENSFKAYISVHNMSLVD